METAALIVHARNMHSACTGRCCAPSSGMRNTHHKLLGAASLTKVVREYQAREARTSGYRRQKAASSQPDAVAANR